jgi:nicotinamidase/pyrazinamidase
MTNALIVVDMLKDFCDKKGVLAQSNITGGYYGVSIVPIVAGPVGSARVNSDAIFWICDWHDKDDLEFNRFPPHAIKDTWGAEIVSDLVPTMIESSPHELKINKTRYSGFHKTDLEYQLMRLAPKKVTVVGVCTSICVMDTVGGLANRDYNIEVPRNCVADFDPAAHDMALARMEGLYGAQII